MKAQKHKTCRNKIKHNKQTTKTTQTNTKA